LGSKTPKDTAHEICSIGEKKATHNFFNLLILSVMAGAYIGFGAQFLISFTFDAAKYVGAGMARFLGASVFCTGLFMILMTGAELFTGNSLMTVGLFNGKIKLSSLLRNWTIVYLGNFVGAALMAGFIFYSGAWKANENAPGIFALNMAITKVQIPFWIALVKGIGANWLVCMAVWLWVSSDRVIDKIIGMYLPIVAFVVMGFEHSIANMFLLPMGLLLKSVVSTSGAVQLTISSVIFNNLIPVTIGNIIGGVVFMAIPYWYVYIRNHQEQQVSDGQWLVNKVRVVRDKLTA